MQRRHWRTTPFTKPSLSTGLRRGGRWSYKKRIGGNLIPQFEGNDSRAHLQFKHFYLNPSLNFDQAGPCYKLVDNKLVSPKRESEDVEED